MENSSDTTVAAVVPEKRSRRGKSKTKTGCITCKIRRVKCDETKPHCLRCTKFGRICGGYVQPKPAVTTNYTMRDGKIFIQPRKTQLDVRSPTIFIPGSADERRYFHRFCQTTLHELSGLFANIFWTQIVPQTAILEASVRHAVNAIAAFTKTLEAAPASSFHIDNQTVRDEHHKFGLEQYAKAVSSLRETIAANQSGLRTALIAAMLFVCLETLQGDHRSASHQIRQGLALLEQAERARYKKDAHQHIEEDLFQMWNAQNVQYYYLMFSQSPRRPRVLLPHLQEVHRHVFRSVMPRFFTSLTDAKRALGLLLNAIAQLHHPCASFAPVDKVGRYAEHRASLSQWEAAFQPMLKKAQAETGRLEGSSLSSTSPAGTTTPTLLLSIYHRMALIMLAGTITLTETMYDSMTREFRYIVTTVGTILDLTRNPSASSLSCSSSSSNPPPRTPRFSFDVSLLPPLHIVGSKCRNGVLRRQAIHLLRQCSVQEGLWTPRGLAEACEWMMRIEETGLAIECDADANATPFIPEENRVKLSRLEPNRRRAWMQCVSATEVLEPVHADVLPEYGGLERHEGRRRVWETTITW